MDSCFSKSLRNYSFGLVFLGFIPALVLYHKVALLCSNRAIKRDETINSTPISVIYRGYVSISFITEISVLYDTTTFRKSKIKIWQIRKHVFPGKSGRLNVIFYVYRSWSIVKNSTILLYSKSLIANLQENFDFNDTCQTLYSNTPNYSY